MITESGDSSLLEKIRAIGQADEVPEGFKTVKQWSEEWNKCPAQTRNLLRKALEHGLVEKKMFRIFNGSRYFVTPHYREL